MTDGPKRQFISCKFRSADSRAYIYHNDGKPVAPGDIVKVPDRYGEGWQRAVVVSIEREKPAFKTKAIIGKAENEVERD